MFFEDGRKPFSPRGPEAENPTADQDSGGMYFVDFGPLFGEEIRKVLRYRSDGMLSEIVFWRDEYSF